MKKHLLILFLSLSCIIKAQNWTLYPNKLDGMIDVLYNDSVTDKLYFGGLINFNDTIPLDGLGSFNPPSDISSAIGVDAWKVTGIVRFQNEIYLAGSFYDANIDDYYHLMKWDGINLSPVYADGQLLVDGLFETMKVYNDTLYVGGSFRFKDQFGIMCNGLAKYDGTNWTNIHNFPKWNYLNSNINIVDQIAIYKNEIYVGGRFADTAPIDTMISICKFNGTQWQMLGNGIRGSITQITDMLEYQGKLYIAGDFEKTGTNPGKNLAVWNGAEWEETAQVGGPSYDIVRSMCVYNDELYIAGVFDSVAGVKASNFAKFDGKNWCGLDLDTIQGLVNDLEVFHDELYLVGYIERMGGVDFITQTLNMGVIAKLDTANATFNCVNIVGIDETPSSESNLKLYPNPFNGSFTLEFDAKQSANETLYLIDGLGNTVKFYQFDIISGKNSFDINLESLASGLYYLRFGEKVIKLVKQ